MFVIDYRFYVNTFFMMLRFVRLRFMKIIYYIIVIKGYYRILIKLIYNEICL